MSLNLGMAFWKKIPQIVSFSVHHITRHKMLICPFIGDGNFFCLIRNTGCVGHVEGRHGQERQWGAGHEEPSLPTKEPHRPKRKWKNGKFRRETAICTCYKHLVRCDLSICPPMSWGTTSLVWSKNINKKSPCDDLFPSYASLSCRFLNSSGVVTSGRTMGL